MNYSVCPFCKNKAVNYGTDGVIFYCANCVDDMGSFRFYYDMNSTILTNQNGNLFMMFSISSWKIYNYNELFQSGNNGLTLEQAINIMNRCDNLGAFI